MKTDAQIQLDVIAELKYEPTIHQSNIGVSVKEGIVALRGEVEHYFEKYHAEAAAQRVSGVRGVAMELEVKLPNSVKRSDSDIAHAIDNLISWSALLSKDSVQVKVEGGWVTLSGGVNWHYQKAMLNTSISHLMGVVGISNQLVIKHEVAKSEVKSDIVEALNRRAKDDAKSIDIQVKGGEVTLSGSVHSWNEKALVIQAAWSNSSVVSVVDNLQVIN